MRNFANSLILPFQGATGAQVITAHKKSNQPPQAVSLDIPWRAYALQMNIGGGVTTFNGAVSIDLARGTVSNPLDIVKSVFIDNTSVDRPVYLQSVDTGQIVTCADGTFGWYPLLTFGEQFVLYTDNIIPLRDADQKTKIIFSNASFDTFAGGELNRAQSLFRASGSAQFLTPVIGDLLKSRRVELLSNENSYVTDGSTGQVTATRESSGAIISGVLNRENIITSVSIFARYTTNATSGQADRTLAIQLLISGTVIAEFDGYSVIGNPTNAINRNLIYQNFNTQLRVTNNTAFNLKVIQTYISNGTATGQPILMRGVAVEADITYSAIDLPALA